MGNNIESQLEELRAELRWWIAQKEEAFQKGDLKYMNECRNVEYEILEEIDKVNESISYSKNL
jgi:hypothetical protein